jgi:Flp pilus assembly protein TadD
MSKLQHFRIPLAQFDLSLLPEGARILGSDAFAHAVLAYFTREYAVSGRRALVSIDGDAIDVLAYPDTVADPMSLALQMLNGGKIREAIPLLEQLARGRPQDTELLYNLGIAYSEIGEYQQAVMALKRAIEHDPQHPNALVGLGVAYQRLGQSDQAEAFLRRAIDVQPGNPYALRNLGAVLGRRGEHADALPYFRRAVQAAPNDPAALLGLAKSLESSGSADDETEADSIYRQLIDRYPGTPFEDQAKEARTAIAQKSLRQGAAGKLRPDVVMYILGALETFEREGAPRRQQIAHEIAMLGMRGLDIHDPTPKYQLQSLPGDYTGLHLVSMMYAAFKQIDPSVEAGIDFAEEYKAALALMPPTI